MAEANGCPQAPAASGRFWSVTQCNRNAYNLCSPPAGPLVASLRVLSPGNALSDRGLAGCLGGDDDPGPANGENEEDDENQGRLEGEVVAADNLNPIGHATVNLVLGDELVENVTTSEDGV